MPDEAIDIIVRRLRSDALLIEGMLREDHRQRYFEALRKKKEDPTIANVTAAFFPDNGTATLAMLRAGDRRVRPPRSLLSQPPLRQSSGKTIRL